MKFSILFLIVISSCAFLLKPEKTLEQNANLLLPDYSEMNYWAAHPEKKDLADLVPENSGFTDKQALARADVFFIHPTSYGGVKGNKPWNAKITYSQVNKKTDEFIIKRQGKGFLE